jgi:hypothetical protein
MERFEIQTAVKFQVEVFRIVMPCSVMIVLLYACALYGGWPCIEYAVSYSR